MNPSQKNNLNVPCRFYAQGACIKGDFCPFLHLKQKQKNHNTKKRSKITPKKKQICKFFQSPSGCSKGDNCSFIHSCTTKQIKQTKQQEQQILNIPKCNCIQENKHSNYQHLTNLKKKKNSMNLKQNQLLCVVDNLLGNFVIENFSFLEFQQPHHNKTNNFWYFYNDKNQSLIKLRSKGDQYWFEGDPFHHYCILQWIESNFCSVFHSDTDVISGKVVMTYKYCFSNSERSPPLSIRFYELFQQKKLFEEERQNTERQTIQPISPQTNSLVELPPLAQEDKLAILHHALRIANEDNELSESEEEEEEILEEEDEEEDESSDDLDENFSIFSDISKLIEIPFHGGYSLKFENSFCVDIENWMSSSCTDSLVQIFYNSFISQGGYHVLTLDEGSQKMLDGNSAGCGQACQLSEALSFDILHSLFPEKLNFFLSEMEINYLPLNSQKLDYLCCFEQCKIGVSVTRAWNGPNKPFTRSNARRLLCKKINGLNNALKSVSFSHRWSKQILHIWTPNERVSHILQKELFSSPQIFESPQIPLLILITSTQFQIPVPVSFLFRNS